MVEDEIGHLVYGGGLYMQDDVMAALCRANDILPRYIIDSLRKDHSNLLLPNSSGTRDCRNLKQEGSTCESRRIIIDKAAETDRLLKKVVRRRKGDCPVTLAEELAEKQAGELHEVYVIYAGGPLHGVTLAVSS